MKILTAAQMRRIDKRTEQDFDISAQTLMDNAGRGIAALILRLYPDIRTGALLILCGKGNNGGDGMTAARHLRARGIEPLVVLLARKASLKGAAAHHLELALSEKIHVEEATDATEWARFSAHLDGHDLIVDALLGTGLKGTARDLMAQVIRDINSAGASVISIDIPSGLSGDSIQVPGPAVSADHTLALACPKLPHVLAPASLLIGHLHVIDIGIPPTAIEQEGVTLNLATEIDMARLMKTPERERHKGDFGRLLVIGGCRSKSGAPAMVCKAALRSGAGIVTAATSASAQPILAGHLMEMMTEPLPETSTGSIALTAGPVLRDLMYGSDVVALGPGLTTHEETARMVRAIVSGNKLPVILDADGLNAYAGRSGELSGAGQVLILTPHPGEMARLLTNTERKITTSQVQADRVNLAGAFAREHDCYLVLKGYHTVIADPRGEIWINPTGNPGMATAGSGDVLTGILASLLAQGLPPLEACLLGVYVHGLAGDLAADDLGERSVLAGDIIEFLPDAFQILEHADDADGVDSSK